MTHANAHNKRDAAWVVFFLAIGFIYSAIPASAEVVIKDSDSYAFNLSSSLNTDFIMMENNVDLDTKQRDDRVQYIGATYGFSFDLKFKNEGPEFYLKLERMGLYDYDVPLVIHNTLMTYMGKIKAYHDSELLPKIAEYWLDVPIMDTPLRFKGGLFTYSVGHNISLGGYYRNYGMSLYTQTDPVSWHFYYCWPDISSKNLLGPYIDQEKEQGIDYEHSKAYFFATDVTVTIGNHKFQPYAGLLLDRSDTRRANYFLTPTREDLLGTAGIAWYGTFDKLSLSAEFARNFGRADSADADFQDVTHQGYMVYADASYEFKALKPHSRFIYASGNKVTDDMITNGDTVYNSSKNNAFSVFSPFNGYLADSIYSGIEELPLVAMGAGWGLNYGVMRPSTFYDPRTIENLILVDLGLEYAITDKASITIDWWYLSSAQKGYGMYNGVPKACSPDLGHEVDLYFTYQINKNITFSVLGGAFFPGAFYREERDDTLGSLFTPFVRGDGKADPAFQLETTLTLSF